MEQISSIPRNAIDGEDLICRGATVIKVKDDLAYVRVDQEKGCESCGSKGHCAVMLGSQSVLTVRKRSDISVGMRVEIGMRPTAIFTASVLMFVMPAVAFVVGIGLGYWLADALNWSEQWTGFGLGLVLFGLSYFIIKMITPRLEAKGNYEPVIVRVLDK